MGSRKGLACSGGAKGFEASIASSTGDPEVEACCLSWGKEPLARKGLDSTYHTHRSSKAVNMLHSECHRLV